MQTLSAVSPWDRDLWEMYMTWQPLKRKPLSLLSSVSLPPPPPWSSGSCCSSAPHATPAQQDPQSRPSGTNKSKLHCSKKQGFSNIWCEYFHRSNREESQKYLQFCPLTLKHMILWGCERSQDCSERGCRSSSVWASWLIYVAQSAEKIIVDFLSQTGNQRDGDSN